MELHQGQQAVVDHAARFNVVWVGRRWGKGVLAEHLATGVGAVLLAPYPMCRYLEDAREAKGASLCSLTLHRVVVDEAPGVKNLMALFREDILPSVLDWQGDVWFLGTARDSNPMAEDASDFLKLYRRGLEGEPGWMSYRAPSTENPTFPTELLAEVRFTSGKAGLEQEFLVGP